MLKKIILLSIISFSFFNCSLIQLKYNQPTTLDHYLKQLSKDITKNLAEPDVKKIAVLEFSDIDGVTTKFSRIIAEELTTQLFGNKNFSVIERQLLNRVIEEQKLSLSGQLDEKSVKSLGKILGVDAIITGTYSIISDMVTIYSRLISTETGEIFSVSKIQFPEELVNSLLSDSKKNPKISKNPKITNDVTLNNGIQYQLSNIEINNKDLICKFQVTNLNQDQLVIFYGYCKITSNNGNVFTDSFRSIGDQSASHPVKLVKLKLVQNVPYTYTIKFDEIFEIPEEISLLEFEVADGVEKGYVQFRNIPVQK